MAKRRGDGLNSRFYFSAFLFLTFLLFPKTSDQLGGSHTPLLLKKNKNGTLLTLRSVLPGDLLQSQFFLGHHFLLVFSPVSLVSPSHLLLSYFLFTYSLNASVP